MCGIRFYPTRLEFESSPEGDEEEALGNKNPSFGRGCAQWPAGTVVVRQTKRTNDKVKYDTLFYTGRN